MSESPLVNRTQITTTMSNRLLPYGIELPPED